MTKKQIVALLSEQGSKQENIDALATEKFEKIEKIIAQSYPLEQVQNSFQRLSRAEQKMMQVMERGKEMSELDMAQATASFYEVICSIPTDLLTFLKLIFYLVRHQKESLPDHWAEKFEKKPAPQSNLMNIQSVRPVNYVMQVDNVFRNLPNLQSQNTVYAGRKGRKEINTLVSLSLPEQFALEGINQMDGYDKAVLNGVNSLLANGTVNFTIPMLYHAMTGKENPTVDEGLLQELQRRIEQMRRTLITIDLTEELQAKYLDVDITQPQVQGYLLPLNLISARINGRPVQVYHLLDVPPMLAYAKMKRQLATVPLSLLNAPLNNNATTIPLKNYIIARCESMKNGNNRIKSNKILFEAIYAELGEENANKVRKKRIRDYTEIILTHMIDHNYLKSYTLTKKGRSIDGIEIRLV